MADIVSLGEILMDLVPAEKGRRLTQVTAFAPKPGGAPANVAVAAARLGAAAAFIGKVGNDFFGEFLRETMAHEGVDTRGMRTDDAARTTLAFIAQPDAHSNEYVFYRNPGADQRLRADELDTDLLAHTRVLHFGSISLTDEPARGATVEAIRLARAVKALISFDVNYRPALWSEPAQAVARIQELVGQADILKVNEGEMELLTGSGDVSEGSENLLARGPKLVVVTLGEAGSFFRTAHSSGYAHAFKVEAIDSTGCGDSFVGALLTQLAPHGADGLHTHIQTALRYANAAGAITSTRRGAIPALPTAQQVTDFLEKNP